ncbi:MAG: formate dehydrogenase accessory sulfurtransferase FdhD [Pseudomonadota bacterium]
MNNDKEQPVENLSKNVEVQKMLQGNWISQTISVVQEMPLTIFLNEKEIVTLLCTGTHLEALAIGFLKSEGLIDKREHIRDVIVDEAKGTLSITLANDPVMEEKLLFKRVITSGCGKGTIFYQAIDSLLTQKIESPLILTADKIFLLMSQLNQQATLYKKTRGVHNAALATPETIVLFRSDIGRHNAVDMICGTCFLDNIPLEDKILLTTGRITSEVLLKAAKMRTPFLISPNVATHHAITLAQDIGITLIGDVRGNKLIVYTHPERVR